MLSITSFVLTFFFLKETVKSPAPLSTLFEPLEVPDPEGHHLTHIASTLHIRPPNLQDGLAIGGAVLSVVAKKLPFDSGQMLSIRCLVTNPTVIIALGNFTFLSLIEIAFKNIQPLFLANPISFGGLGFTVEQTDNILSAWGIINGIVQMLANSLQGVAPGMTRGLFVLSVEKGYLGGNLVYIVVAAIGGVAMMVASYLPHKLWD
ncbi:hypothetical protein C0992_006811 [Termitomyces sp. T32_za158]|nr:hypothetical protein C0992_006811 [Termitomyces sp. T32_za158]